MAEQAEAETLEVLDPVAHEEAQQQPRDLTEVEQLATKVGWKPEWEWRGESPHMGADEYLVGDRREARQKLQREVEKLRKEMDATGKTTAKIAADFRRKAIEEAEARIREFTEANDPEAVIKATRDLAKIEAQPADDPIKAWVAENPWFDTDPVANGIAKGAAEHAARAGKTTEQQLAAAKAEVMKRMPELFDDDAPATPAARRSPPALTGGTRTAVPNREPGYADLPPSARTAFTTLVNNGMAQDTAEGRKQYASTWRKFNEGKN